MSKNKLLIKEFPSEKDRLFLVTGRAARTARNFKTGETKEVSAVKTVKFKARKSLKEAANQ